MHPSFALEVFLSTQCRFTPLQMPQTNDSKVHAHDEFLETNEYKEKKKNV